MNTLQFLHKNVYVKIDRKMGSRHPNNGLLYPVNYGYIPGTISGDGEELDCYILGVFKPIDDFRGEVIAVLHRTDDDDDKLIVVPKGKRYTDEQIDALTEFQERWFNHKIFI